MSEEVAGQGIVAGSIPLFAGHPAPELLPIAAVRDIAKRLTRDKSAVRLFNYGDEQGDPRLLEYLLAWLGQSESLAIGRENLMIIGGSTWGVEMIARQLTRPGDAILADAPSYRDALHIFRDAGLEIHAIPIDADGIGIDALRERLAALEAQGRRVRFYYVVPNFQNPAGISVSQTRREAVLELGARYGFAVVEDDVYRDLRFGKAAPASFWQLAGGRGVLRLGSFSKTLAPGLRVGWLLAEANMIERFVESGMLRMGGGANPFTAGIVAESLRKRAVARACGLAARAISDAAGLRVGCAGGVDAGWLQLDETRWRLLHLADFAGTCGRCRVGAAGGGGECLFCAGRGFLRGVRRGRSSAAAFVQLPAAGGDEARHRHIGGGWLGRAGKAGESAGCPCFIRGEMSC